MIFSILFIAEIVKYIIISNCTQAQLTQNFLEAGSIVDFIIWYVPQAIADDIDCIAILILRPVKNPSAPYSLKIVAAVSMTFLYLISTGFSEQIAIPSFGSKKSFLFLGFSA